MLTAVGISTGCKQRLCAWGGGVSLIATSFTYLHLPSPSFDLFTDAMELRTDLQDPWHRLKPPNYVSTVTSYVNAIDLSLTVNPSLLETRATMDLWTYGQALGRPSSLSTPCEAHR